MRRTTFFAILVILVPVTVKSEETIRAATFNLHYLDEESNDPLMRWAPREAAVLETLREIDADIVAFQEMETFHGRRYNRENRQAQSVAAAFPGFRFAATSSPEAFPNTQPVLYRADRFVPLQQGFFFFSPTPDVPYSEPWFGRFPSFASWVRLAAVDPDGEIDGEKAVILVVNVHVDRTSHRNQIRSARLTAERLGEIRRPGDEVILLGDFNAFRNSRVVRIASRGDAATAEGAPNGRALVPVSPHRATYHFYRGFNLFPAIDHVLVSGGLASTGARVVRRRPAGVWPSDHYPVVVELSID